ncbi:division/cell wall cluster transcriptional repressor MraZ [Psychroflexus lacisalsi]|uniref:Transcriptional regulator MraZ n=2 Tax=Psychroflexus lacisalsi TaxID=503928 RepID=A0ABP3VLS6_9FLAO
MVKCGKNFDIFEIEIKLIMNTLIGSYECKVDTKGRLMLPSGLKKQMLPILEEGFVLKRSVFQPCLELYPMSQWNLLMEKMNGLNRFNKKNNDFIRKFSAGVKMIEVDANGRLLIPKDLISFASIEKEIVVSSAINIVEIWDKDKYESVVSESEDFADLAEDVMGFETNE